MNAKNFLLSWESDAASYVRLDLDRYVVARVYQYANNLPEWIWQISNVLNNKAITWSTTKYFDAQSAMMDADQQLIVMGYKFASARMNAIL